MSWKYILKRVDYNDLDDNSKRRIAYALTGDEVYFELTDLYGDFPLYSVESTDDLPKGMGFPKHFKLYSEGDMEISEEEGADPSLYTNISVYAKNPNDKKESYYLGHFREEQEIADLEHILRDNQDLATLEELMLVPDFKFASWKNTFMDADYNKLVGYLKETNKWEEISHIEDKMMKLPEVSHSKEVDKWLEDAEDYASQKFEQSYSRDDESSIGTAQEFYKLLEYLRTNKETSWNEGDLKRKFPTAMLIVSETLDGLP